MQLTFSDKSAARKYLSALRGSFTEIQRIEKSRKICDQIINSAEFLNAKLVLVYYPIKSEIDILPIAKKAFELGKNVAFPISQKSSCLLDFRLVKSLDELSVGAYGIHEPKENAPHPIFPDKKEEALCIVPALSIDKKGSRLGYGKGFYDRFLKDFNGISLGAVFEELLCDSLPTESTDIPLEMIITDTGSVTIK